MKKSAFKGQLSVIPSDKTPDRRSKGISVFSFTQPGILSRPGPIGAGPNTATFLDAFHANFLKGTPDVPLLARSAKSLFLRDRIETVSLAPETAPAFQKMVMAVFSDFKRSVYPLVGDQPSSTLPDAPDWAIRHWIHGETEELNKHLQFRNKSKGKFVDCTYYSGTHTIIFETGFKSEGPNGEENGEEAMQRIFITGRTFNMQHPSRSFFTLDVNRLAVSLNLPEASSHEIAGALTSRIFGYIPSLRNAPSYNKDRIAASTVPSLPITDAFQSGLLDDDNIYGVVEPINQDGLDLAIHIGPSSLSVFFSYRNRTSPLPPGLLQLLQGTMELQFLPKTEAREAGRK
jgi:hypothetical protein